METCLFEKVWHVNGRWEFIPEAQVKADKENLFSAELTCLNNRYEMGILPAGAVTGLGITYYKEQSASNQWHLHRISFGEKPLIVDWVRISHWEEFWLILASGVNKMGN